MSEPMPPSPLALASLVLGGLSVLLSCCCYGLPFNLVGLVLGVVALSQSRDVPEDARNRSFAWGGIGLSVLSMVIALGFLVLGFGMGMMSALMQEM